MWGVRREVKGQHAHSYAAFAGAMRHLVGGWGRERDHFLRCRIVYFFFLSAIGEKKRQGKQGRVDGHRCCMECTSPHTHAPTPSSYLATNFVVVDFFCLYSRSRHLKMIYPDPPLSPPGCSLPGQRAVNATKNTPHPHRLAPRVVCLVCNSGPQNEDAIEIDNSDTL